jgi:CBS domain-containing protein
LAVYGFVRDILAEKGSNVFATSPAATVRQAVREMNEHGVGGLLVVAEGTPVGMFTERDVMRRVVDAGLDPETTSVVGVMTRDVVVIRPTATVEEAMAVMTAHRFRHLPVVDEGKLVGLVSIGDVTRRVSLGQAAEIQHLVDYITGGSAGR